LRFTFGTRPLTVLIPHEDTLGSRKTPREEGGRRKWVLGHGAAVPAKIWRADGAGGREKGGEVTMNSPRVGLRPETGRGWRWRARSAAPGDGGYGGARSGEVAAPWGSEQAGEL
jgi:hypothetical protein